MRFGLFKEYRAELSDTLDDVKKYLSQDFSSLMREIRAGLGSLTLADNFESFTETVTIGAGLELPIRNKLRNIVPSKWIKVRTDTAGLSVCDGDTTWTTDFVYLKNTHGSLSATITVVFLR